jgi:hypothetical protein
MLVDLSTLPANLESDFTLWRTGEGEAGQWAVMWHTLALKAEGDRFTVSFDGKALLLAEDETFPHAGKVALWTKADSVTYFDTISIMPLKYRARRSHGLRDEKTCL